MNGLSSSPDCLTARKWRGCAASSASRARPATRSSAVTTRPALTGSPTVRVGPTAMGFLDTYLHRPAARPYGETDCRRNGDRPQDFPGAGSVKHAYLMDYS